VYAHLGHPVLKMLLSVAVPRENVRSPIYSAVIYLLHRNVTPWPVIALNALLTSWTIWLVVRSIVRRRPLAVFLLLVVALSLLSTVSWYVSSFMPDILGALLYLCLYLLVFGARDPAALGDRRCRRTRLVDDRRTPHLPGAGWSSVHLSGAALAAALAAAARPRQSSAPGSGHRSARRCVCAGRKRPYLRTALAGRAGAALPDGPHRRGRPIAPVSARPLPAAALDALHLGRRPAWNSDDFLWAPHGIYQSATPQQKELLHSEEWPLVLGPLRTHPRRQALESWKNFVWELTHFGINPTAPNADWLPDHLEENFPGSRARFLRSRPREDGPLRPLFCDVQETVGAIAAVAVLALLPWLWVRRRSMYPLATRLFGLTAIVLFIVVANAAVTGILSSASVRYEGRVIWLLPMLAGLLLYSLLTPADARTA
jgi:hypothetical protein